MHRTCGLQALTDATHAREGLLELNQFKIRTPQTVAESHIFSFSPSWCFATPNTTREHYDNNTNNHETSSAFWSTNSDEDIYFTECLQNHTQTNQTQCTNNSKQLNQKRKQWEHPIWLLTVHLFQLKGSNFMPQAYHKINWDQLTEKTQIFFLHIKEVKPRHPQTTQLTKLISLRSRQM